MWWNQQTQKKFKKSQVLEIFFKKGALSSVLTCNLRHSNTLSTNTQVKDIHCIKAYPRDLWRWMVDKVRCTDPRQPCWLQLCGTGIHCLQPDPKCTKKVNNNWLSTKCYPYDSVKTCKLNDRIIQFHHLASSVNEIRCISEQLILELWNGIELPCR